MSANTEKILEQALSLDESERAELANSLLESLEPTDPDADRAWAEEIRRRVEDLKAGRVETIPWSEVRSELEAKLRSIG